MLNECLAFGILVVTIALMIRGVEVRLTLLVSAFLLAGLAGDILAVFDKFRSGMIDEVVVPLCAAMGFAAVLRATQCDKHLSTLLLMPAHRAGFMIVPLGMLAAFATNIALPSQTSTAASVGPVLLPLLAAAGIAPLFAASSLLVGASFGGDLLSPAAQDPLVIARATHLQPTDFTARLFWPCLLGIIVAAAAFCFLHRRHLVTRKVSSIATHLSYFKALIPFVPLFLIVITSPQFALFPKILARYPSGLPVLHAMLLGAALALVSSWQGAGQKSKAFFAGMGESYSSVISLTIVARCFGLAIGLSGLSALLLRFAADYAWIMRGTAFLFPSGLAWLSGSASGPIAAFAETALSPLGASPEVITLGSLACLAGAFGRTLSPVAAVVVYTADLAGCSVKDILRPAFVPMILGMGVSLVLVVLKL
jgi:C4-dicarboxylate transporter, DcuC family